MSSLAGYLANVDLVKFYGPMCSKSDHNIAKIASEFFDEFKHPFITFIEKLMNYGAGPSLIHSWSVFLDENYNNWRPKPIFPSFVPDEWKKTIASNYPNLLKNFYENQKTQEFFALIGNDLSILNTNCRTNIEMIDKETSIFNQMKKFQELNNKEIFVVPLPLDIALCGCLEKKDEVYCTIGNGYKIYSDVFINIYELEEDIEVIIHELFHIVVHGLIKENNMIIAKVRDMDFFNEKSSGIYNQANVESQIDETVTQALTMGWIKHFLGDSAFKRALLRAENNGFVGSIKIVDLCREEFIE